MNSRTRFYTGLLQIAFLCSTAAFAQGGGGMGGPGGHHGGGPGSFPGHHELEMEHNLVLPQIAVGPDISTTLILMSRGDLQHQSWLEAENVRVTGRVYFFHQDGLPWPVQVNGQAESSTFDFEVAAGALVSLELSSQGPNTPGWALVVVEEEDSTADWGTMDGHQVFRGERVNAVGFYTLRDAGGGILSRVGVVPSVFETGLFLNTRLLAQIGAGVRTGVAFVNTGAERLEVTVRLRDDQAQVVAERVIEVDGGHQMALFVDEIFPLFAPEDFRGTLEMEAAGEGLVAMGLLATQDILTALPTHHFGQWRQGAMP